MFTSEEDDENNNLNEEQEEILNEHIEYHEEMKSLMENVREVAQRRGIEAAKSLLKDKPKKPERTVESLFSVEKAGPTEAQTNAYLESRRPNSTQPSAGRLPVVMANPETWEAAATCIKAVNATINRSHLLEKRVGLGFFMEKGEDLFRDAKLLGKVEGTFESWIKKNTGLSSRYARKLRAIARVICNYPKLYRLNMSISDTYKRLPDIRKMLEVEQYRVAWSSS